MSKNKDYSWNAAYIGDEDWKATMGSEVFRNFIAIELKKEAMEKANKTQEVESLDIAFDIIRKSAEPISNSIPAPFRSNYDYEGLETLNEDLENLETLNEDLDELDELDKLDELDELDKLDETELDLEASLKSFENEIKEANLKEAEIELGLDKNYYFKITRGKDV